MLVIKSYLKLLNRLNHRNLKRLNEKNIFGHFFQPEFDTTDALIYTHSKNILSKSLSENRPYFANSNSLLLSL